LKGLKAIGYHLYVCLRLPLSCAVCVIQAARCETTT